MIWPICRLPFSKDFSWMIFFFHNHCTYLEFVTKGSFWCKLNEWISADSGNSPIHRKSQAISRSNTGSIPSTFGWWIGPKLLRIPLSIERNDTFAQSDILLKQLIMTEVNHVTRHLHEVKHIPFIVMLFKTIIFNGNTHFYVSDFFYFLQSHQPRWIFF